MRPAARYFLWIVGGLFVLSVVLALSTTWFVVDYREHGPDGTHFFVPVPAGLARLALPFVDREAQRIDLEIEEGLGEAALAVVRELRNIPDCELVRVESPGEAVSIRKSGDQILVHVDEPGEKVRVRAPLALAEAVLEGYDGHEIYVADVLPHLGKIPNGELVSVTDAEMEVHVWVW